MIVDEFVAEKRVEAERGDARLLERCDLSGVVALVRDSSAVMAMARVDLGMATGPLR
ncbi:MAG: hypothetical protein RQ833_08460 [Sphingomonadaceae bacterium]|nr:hypothetical protein [Sphingomonadaceae bacterium]